MGDRWTDHVLQDFPTSVVPGMIDFPDFLFLGSVDRIPSPSAVETPGMIEPRPTVDPRMNLNDRVTRRQALPTTTTISVLTIVLMKRPEIRLF
jgi:hypothetical protein